MFRKSSAAALLMALAVSACGDSTGEQALIGGGVGAGAAAILGGSPLIGAAVGAGGNVLYCKRNPIAC